MEPGGGGATSLAELTDVDFLEPPEAGNLLAFTRGAPGTPESWSLDLNSNFGDPLPAPAVGASGQDGYAVVIGAREFDVFHWDGNAADAFNAVINGVGGIQAVLGDDGHVTISGPSSFSVYSPDSNDAAPAQHTPATPPGTDEWRAVSPSTIAPSLRAITDLNFTGFADSVLAVRADGTSSTFPLPPTPGLTDLQQQLSSALDRITALEQRVGGASQG